MSQRDEFHHLHDATQGLFRELAPGVDGVGPPLTKARLEVLDLVDHVI